MRVARRGNDRDEGISPGSPKEKQDGAAAAAAVRTDVARALHLPSLVVAGCIGVGIPGIECHVKITIGFGNTRAWTSIRSSTLPSKLALRLSRERDPRTEFNPPKNQAFSQQPRKTSEGCYAGG